MLNYIKSECYRALHSRGYLVFFGLCILMAVLINLPVSGDESYSVVTFPMAIIIHLFNPITILTLCVSDMVFGEEYKNQTMKNVLAGGYTRTQLYFGKFAVELIFAFGIALAAFGAFSASAFLLLDAPSETVPQIQSFYLVLLGCVPVWLGGLALAHMILFLFRSTNVGTFAFMAVFYFPGVIFGLLGYWKPIFGKLGEYLLSSQIDPLVRLYLSGSAATFGDLLRPAAISLVYIAVFLVLGLILYRRKEI